MKRYFLHTVQGKLIGVLLIFMTIMLAVSIYTTRYMSETVMFREKENKLLGIASFLEKKLGDRGYDGILEEAGASGATKEEKLAVLNQKLSEVTDEVSSMYAGLGVGFYSIDLDSILTYGPSSEYGSNVGKAIGADHPGRTVMSSNEPVVSRGTMVRGNIMNAMCPIERNGRVIGYTWANELTTDIEKEYVGLTSTLTVFLVLFFIFVIATVILLSRRIVRNVDKIVAGIKEMRFDLSKRIERFDDEFGEVSENINDMADHIEKSTKEKEALAVAKANNRAQRDFLARMSHELRTPMNGVLGMTRLAMQAETKEDGMLYLKKIQSSATLLLGIINDILDFSKIEEGKLTLDKHPFSIREIADNINELIRPRTAEKGLAFSVEIDDSVPKMATGDSLKLSQVLLNLLGNSVKFTQEGFIKLKMAALPQKDHQFRLVCAVSDSGIGISEEQQKLLFKPFSQADSSTARQFGGTGLGLSISKALVELMGGVVSLDSAAGEGSTFSFYVVLDAYEGPALVHDGQTETAERLYDGYHVLLAEDIEINREIALAVFTEFGFSIDFAENGEEAVRAFQEKRYDLIFMDIRMPHMDGLEATRRIRALEKQNEHIPIIAVTANAMNEDRLASMEAGMDGHISKPLSIDEIKKEIRRVLAKQSK